jgi:hypothetical protein
MSLLSNVLNETRCVNFGGGGGEERRRTDFKPDLLSGAERVSFMPGIVVPEGGGALPTAN